jgi:hypothetical protein
MDQEYFPPARMCEIIDLHKHDQRYGMFHLSVALSGQVWFYKILQNLETGKYFKPVYIGVTVYLGQRFLYRNMYWFFGRATLGAAFV